MQPKINRGTVVLRRWKSVSQTFGSVTCVDKVNWPSQISSEVFEFLHRGIFTSTDTVDKSKFLRTHYLVTPLALYLYSMLFATHVK